LARQTLLKSCLTSLATEIGWPHRGFFFPSSYLVRRTDSPCRDDERRHSVGHKEYMQLHEPGAARRLKLSLSSATGRQPKPQDCASQILPHHELRRLVADMVD
jgi:hypothetical protein